MPCAAPPPPASTAARHRPGAGPNETCTGPPGMWTGPQTIGIGPHSFGTGPNLLWTGPNLLWTGPNLLWTGPNLLWTGPQVFGTRPAAVSCDATSPFQHAHRRSSRTALNDPSVSGLKTPDSRFAKKNLPRRSTQVKPPRSRADASCVASTRTAERRSQ